MTTPPGLEIERDGQILLARLEGDVDLSCVDALRASLLASVDNRDMGLVIDLTAASYLDSAGINMLFDLAESLGRRQIQLAAVVPEGGIVARVASLVDLGSALPVHRSAEAAVTALEKRPGAPG
jgi:stage II sporulation protein AA (anti-sigma F factor antagonist)